MCPCIGIRREDKSPWERRVPLAPSDVADLVGRLGVKVAVQPSPNRVFADDEYRRAGATIDANLGDCPVVLGIKEIPIHLLRPETTYVFFSHVIKGQAYNMPMLRKLMELRCNLIDYERVTDDHGRRLIFFGRYAGIAGAIETLWALGQRLQIEGFDTPFAQIQHAHDYRDADDAKRAIARAGLQIVADGLPPGLPPLTMGVAGYGNVAGGAWEILEQLPVTEVSPDELCKIDPAGADPRTLYVATFHEEHMVRNTAPEESFDRRWYYDHPETYVGIFEACLPHLSVVINGIYWDDRYPRLITKAFLQRLYANGRPRLRVIGDISCDIEGSIECTVRATEQDNPVYVYDPATGATTDGVIGPGPVVMAVDILPAGLPRDASIGFSGVLKNFIPAIAGADFGVPYGDLALPGAIRRALILHQGRLTPDYDYLNRFI